MQIEKLNDDKYIDGIELGYQEVTLKILDGDLKGRQYKINTGVKIIPSQWNKDKQMAIISNCFSKLDNANNKIVNKRINIIYEHYNDFKEYICNVEDIESEFYEVLKRKL